MAIKFGLYNYSVFFSALSPLFISVYLLFNSVFQGNLRGLIFLVGNSLASLFGNFMKSAIKIPRGKFKYGSAYDPSEHGPLHDHCDIFEPANSELRAFGVPSSHAVFYGYALTYLGLGIMNNQTNKPGIPFWILMAFLGVMDLGFRGMSKCDNAMAIGAGILMGGLIGAGWFYLVLYGWPNGDGDKMVYNLKDDVHNPEKCKLGAKTFKCSYKKI